MTEASSTRAALLLLIGVAAALLALSGCKVGPNYKAPHVDTPESFTNAQAPTTSPTTRESVINAKQAPWIEWWTKFDDPELNSLVTRAVAANHELAVARARVQEARAIERITKSGLYPTVDLSAAALKTRGSAAGFGFPYGIPGQESNLFQIGFDATYEVDLFGGIRRSIEAAGAAADATVDERRAVQVTLLGEVARNYIGLRALQRRLEVARANLADQRQTLDVVQRRFNNGLAPNFDLVRAAAQVAATESSIPPLEAGIQQTMYGLAVLLGEQPTALTNELTATAPIPPVPPTVPVGMPSELLRRRPDVMAAERLLAAATALQGVATAEFFPHLLLGGTAGVQSRQFSELFSQHEPSSGFYSAGPAARWTIFDGGRRVANLDLSKARVAAALASYEGTVLTALRDVESSLTAYSHDQTRRESLTTLTAQNENAVRIAKREYDNGLIDLLDVLEVQRNLYASQDALAQSDQAVSSDLVAIYKALGGGWENESDPRTAKAQ
jgi:NodT family efflux transporter outer membrane factor (OMF) lipoprotein